MFLGRRENNLGLRSSEILVFLEFWSDVGPDFLGFGARCPLEIVAHPPLRNALGPLDDEKT